ncbi:MAG: tyrosine--tRNA ligase [Oscillospiraceae bacterium]|jgi:tyrosyl-tRNA synthetase|nr:tyrosine--tRNA ligase [Oscillospiraceae bacterium]
MTLYEELTRRGLIAQMTHPEQIEALLNKGGSTFYMGFDATADSLHVGHYTVLTIIRRMQMAGMRPILLLGTGTTMVGDPSGRTDMRQMLSVEEINYNADRFVEQMGRVVDLDNAIVERNGDWLMKLNYIELLRDIGVHFSVNKMLAFECFQSRMETGLTFIELNYMIMQSYDFLHLFRKHGCTLQLGGNDQWGNIVSGVDLVRRVEGKEVHGMTFTLLTNKDGVKMGKTVGGAVWLDKNRFPVYDFFQYWRNVDDAEVIKCLKMLTFLPIEEIEAMETWEGSQLNKAKEILAWELTKDVHGKEEADKALEAAKALFGGGGSDENMPSTTLADSDFVDGAVNILDLMVRTGLAPSKGEARRLVQQNGVSIDMGGSFAPIADIAFAVKASDLDGKEIIIRKGKKVFHKISR